MIAFGSDDKLELGKIYFGITIRLKPGSRPKNYPSQPYRVIEEITFDEAKKMWREDYGITHGVISIVKYYYKIHTD